MNEGEDRGPRAVLFDIDGTLIESGGSSDRAWHRAFADLLGIDVDVPAHTGRGVPDPEVGREVFVAYTDREPEPAELARVMAKRLEYLPEEVERSPGYRVLDGAEELLQRLVAAGVLVGLTTGNVEAAAHIKLARGGLNRFFTFGGYGSDSPDRAELTRRALERAASVVGEPLDPAATVSAGDTPRDIDAGHAAGLRVVGVATGAYTTDQLEEARADWAIASLRDWPYDSIGMGGIA
jgi:phosphoglycolate phosphatase-like HAD superfamily hydrolase